MTKKERHDAILDAAERVLARCALSGATIEAVAAEAGMSKGGVLHYYGTKRKLLTGVLTRFEERFFAHRDTILASLPDHPARLARATLIALRETRKASSHAAHHHFDMLEDPEYRSRIGDMRKRLYQDILAGAKDPGEVVLAAYMLDGIWLNRLFDSVPISSAHERKAHKELEKALEAAYAEYR